MPDPIITEAVILIRQGSRTMAVHVPNIILDLDAIVDEPELPPPGPVIFYRNTGIIGYAMVATGTADKLTIWQGTDPFDRAELDSPRAEVESGNA